MTPFPSWSIVMNLFITGLIDPVSEDTGCRRRRRSSETGSISPVMNRFMTIDQDGNGVIDGNETMIMFKEEHTNKDLYEIENMLKEIDHNGNGVIEPAEFDHDLK